MASFLDVLGGLSDDVGYKGPARTATTGDLGDSLIGLLVIDGVQLVGGDRVLVWQQADQSTNGIYVANTGAWNRSIDFSSSSSILDGTQVLVVSGTVYGGTIFACQTANPVVGSTDIEFAPAPVTNFNFSAAFAALPTTLPALSGVVWNNGGSICIS